MAALDAVLASAPGRPWLAVKTAEIKTSPRTFFVHVRVPDGVAARLREVQREVVPDASRHQDIDHVTLVYTRKPPNGGEHPPEKVHAALEALRDVASSHEPIRARVQGWGYFDGAAKDGKTTTALVALLDAPGLDHLHVDMARALREHGIEPSDDHVFTPHVTIGYLERHGRADKPLPPLSGSFTIDKAHVAAREHHEVPLTGASGLAKAAATMLRKTGSWHDRLLGGRADDKTPSDFDRRQLAKGEKHEREHTREAPLAREIAMDHLAEDPTYYDKLDKLERSR